MTQLIREIPIRISVRKTPTDLRGFLFYVAAGFSKPVDPMSGMSVNLALVDDWLQKVKVDWDSQIVKNNSNEPAEALLDWGRQIQENLSLKAQEAGAELASLSFREAREWSFHLSNKPGREGWLFTYPYFLESFMEDGGFDLVRLKISWQRGLGCSENLHAEGLKILKQIPLREQGNMIGYLEAQVGYELTSGSFLDSMELEFLCAKYSLKI